MTLRERIRAGAIITIALLAVGFVFLGNQRPVHAQVVPNGEDIDQGIFCFLDQFPTTDVFSNSPCGQSSSASSTLTVIKMVSGTSTPSSDFDIHVSVGGTAVADDPGSAAGTTYLGLDPGTYSITETVNAAGVAAGVKLSDYTATFSGCDSDGDITLAAGDTDSCTIKNAYTATNGGGGASSDADLSVTKTVNNPNPNPGDTVIYTITVTNAGPSAASGVLVNDPLPIGLTYVSDDSATTGTTYDHTSGLWSAGTIADSASEVLHITATVKANTGGDAITNTAAVTSGNTDPNGNNNDASATINVGNGGGGGGSTESDLTITKTADKTAPNVGDEVTYTITVNNAGPATASGVSVSDILPSELTFVSTSTGDTAGLYNSSAGIWTVGTIADEGSAVLHITATVNPGTAGDSIANTATVSDTNGDSNPTNTSTATITVNTAGGTPPNPTTSDISVTKSASPTTPNVGDTVTYTITATDSGMDATGVVIQDQLPEGLTFVSTSSADTIGVYDPVSGNWTIGKLASTTTATLHIMTTVDSGEANGTVITNMATVTGGDTSTGSGPNTASAPVTVTIPSSNGGGGGGTTPTTPSTPGGGGGGGNGPIAGSYGGGGNGPIVPEGQVLGASTSTLPNSCSQYLTAFIRTGQKNDVGQVERLQTFLNTYEGAKLTIDGTYDAATLAATEKFQKTYGGDILAPWGISAPTGYVYLTTRKEVNEIYCHFTMNFPLTAGQQAIINASLAAAHSGTGVTVSGVSHSSVSGSSSAGSASGVSKMEQAAEAAAAEMDMMGSSSTGNATSTPSSSPINGIGSFLQHLFGH